MTTRHYLPIMIWGFEFKMTSQSRAHILKCISPTDAVQEVHFHTNNEFQILCALLLSVDSKKVYIPCCLLQTVMHILLSSVDSSNIEVSFDIF